MKKFVLGVVLVSILCACSFSVGTQKDLITGLSYSYKGFAVEEVLLVGPDNVKLKNNEVLEGNQVSIVMKGITNYDMIKDKAFPGMSIVVTDKENKVAMKETDVLSSRTGFSEEIASTLKGTVTVGNPMKAGETYHIKMKVWDKNNPESEITAEVDIVVK
jgi:hypothetical protein